MVYKAEMSSSGGTQRPQVATGRAFAEPGASSAGATTRAAEAGDAATDDVPTMLHDLSQPLSAISNYALGCRQRLESGKFDAKELVAVLERISAEARRAGDLVQRLRKTCAEAPKDER